MICYSCNRRVGTKWVDVCPFCGNDQIEAQHLEMHAKIKLNFERPPADQNDAAGESRGPG
jgi:hypothetical protein